MNINDYILSLNSIEINTSAVNDIEERYKIKCPEILAKIISNSKETVFLDNEVRILSLSEMLNAPRNLHVDFIKLGMLPFADCFDNNFAVYCRNKTWGMYNIVDQCKYNEKLKLEELFT